MGLDIEKPKYCFKTELKKEFLNGKKAKDLAKELNFTDVYISMLFHNTRFWDEYLINKVMLTIGYSKTKIKKEFNKYFERV